jgi:ribosomal protein L29
MAILKAKDVAKMTEKERNDKLKDLRTELIKTKVGNKKNIKSSPGEIRRTIARLMTANKLNEKTKEKSEDKKETKKGVEKK